MISADDAPRRHGSGPRNVDGYAFEYHEHGSGETVVLVHGSSSDHRTWQGQQDALAERYRTVTFSRRYHWPNEPIADGIDYSMAEQLEDLRAFVCSLGSTSVHLIGHSYGAFLCLLLTISDPNIVRTLVLEEAPVIPLVVSLPPKPPALLKLLATRPRTGIAIIRFAATGLGPATKAARRDDLDSAIRHFGTAVLGRDRFDCLSAERLEQVRTNTIKAEFLGSGFSPITEEEVRRVQAPTLLISGQQSPALFHRLTELLQQLLPDTERVVIPAASHIMHEDNAAAVNAAVLSFLDRH